MKIMKFASGCSPLKGRFLAWLRLDRLCILFDLSARSKGWRCCRFSINDWMQIIRRLLVPKDVFQGMQFRWLWVCNYAVELFASSKLKCGSNLS